MQKSFIEVQFPVSKISKESYKERKANLGQTLTGLGKWWGRKPLILVRAVILGVLMPASDNPKKDMEIFLKTLSMDDEGLIERKVKSLPIKIMYENASKEEKNTCFDVSKNIIKIKKEINKKDLEITIFKRLTYDEKLRYCIRPEELSNLKKESWDIINEHLQTQAESIQELVEELSVKRYGKVVRVADCFSGGGSIPFEARRLGCEIYATDLNPVATLLTWASINIVGATEEEITSLRKFQKKVFLNASKRIQKLGVECNEFGWKGYSYLYCTEVMCPECGYRVPLLPSMVIGKGTKTIVKLEENSSTKTYVCKVLEGVSDEEINKTIETTTLKNYNLSCPHCKKQTPIPSIRKDQDDGVKKPYRYNTPNGLRRWEKGDFIAKDEDIFRDILYCIRYEEEVYKDDGKIKKIKHYVSPSDQDIEREKRVNYILAKYIDEWQQEGIIPSTIIQNGWNTNQPIYEKGWAYWHQLFNPRQLLIIGILMQEASSLATTPKEFAITLLGINKCADWNSKLSVWHAGAGVENSQNTFMNQSLNTLFNYGVRGLENLSNSWFFNINNQSVEPTGNIETKDARDIRYIADIWITDPPYADAVNYHELTEFFVAWDKEVLKKQFPHWDTDTKRVLAVQGVGESFSESMIEIYRNLNYHTTNEGMHVVMFTHSDVKVWAELALILWSSGFKVTSAWSVATETESGGLKDGNYVTGTVNLVLRKQLGDATAYLDELYMDIEDEVKAQIDSMHKLDEGEEPNFSDGDYLLAAYAASLKVLTSYKNIEDIDLEYELKLARENPEKSEVVRIINEARKIAYDYLIPTGFDPYHWKSLSSEERFYIKGLELQKNGCYQLGSYQEIARGFGVVEYTDILASTRANQVRLKTPNDYEMKSIGDSSKFGHTLVRTMLAAIYITEKEESPNKGLGYIKKELANYWSNRELIIEVLNYMHETEAINGMETTWGILHKSIGMLKAVVENDSI